MANTSRGIARPIPMKRELKDHRIFSPGGNGVFIARPIPMKRELKELFQDHGMRCWVDNRKAHPDEKGTERFVRMPSRACPDQNRKAHPDEKGTESYLLPNSGKMISYRKAHPDEKGTERLELKH